MAALACGLLALRVLALMCRGHLVTEAPARRGIGSRRLPHVQMAPSPWVAPEQACAQAHSSSRATRVGDLGLRPLQAVPLSFVALTLSWDQGLAGMRLQGHP